MVQRTGDAAATVAGQLEQIFPKQRTRAESVRLFIKRKPWGAAGIRMEGTGSRLLDTYVGTNLAGTAALGNDTGVVITGSGNAKTTDRTPAQYIFPTHMAQGSQLV